MPHEIERKFLVVGDEWRASCRACQRVKQAYLAKSDLAIVRVRIVDEHRAFVTIKSAGLGVSRAEFEYPIPCDHAHELVRLRTGLIIEKRRHLVHIGDTQWEIDEFEGHHGGLVLAELELSDPAAPFRRPNWLGKEVTGDPRYYNAFLAMGEPQFAGRTAA